MSKEDFVRAKYDHRGIEITFPIQTYQEDLPLWDPLLSMERKR